MKDKTIKSVLEELVSHFAEKDGDEYWGYDTNVGNMTEHFDQALKEIKEIINNELIGEDEKCTVFSGDKNMIDELTDIITFNTVSICQNHLKDYQRNNLNKLL